jgi:electron transfer flavoprotein beta subunit
MKILVCIKQVVTREWQVRVNDAKTWVRDQDASWELNEPDAYALEEGLRLKEKHGGEVVVVSAGPARVVSVLREALARGADRAIHVSGDHLATADAFGVADAIAAATADEKPDLVSPAFNPTIRDLRRSASCWPSGSARRTRPSSCRLTSRAPTSA